MLDTKNMSKLGWCSSKFDKIQNEKLSDLIPSDSISNKYEDFMEENKDMDPTDRWRLWVELNNKEKVDLYKKIYNDLLRLPIEISKITDSFIMEYSGLRDTSLFHKRNRKHSDLGDLYFKKYLIEKYNLDGFQFCVMEGNQDLIDILYSEYEIMNIQNKERKLPYFMYDGSMGDKLVKNLKLLVNNNDMYNMVLNNFSLLLDSYIFYIDIEKLLDEYQNITVDDLKKLLFMSREEFCNIISLLNNCSEDIKNKIIYMIEPLKSDDEIFPCLMNDVVDSDKSKTITIIDRNEFIFKKYNYFFKDNLDIFKLVNTNVDIIDFLVVLKKSFIYNIPTLVDTRRTQKNYYFEQEEEFGPNCGQVEIVEILKMEHIENGNLYTNENIVKKYLNIIKFITDNINNGVVIEVEDILNLDMDVDAFNFLASACGMYTINKTRNKSKKRRYEYNGEKPRL